MQTYFTCLITLLLLFPLAMQAQKVEKKFTKELCNCSEKIDVGESLDELDRKLTDCIQQVYDNNREGLVSQFHQDRSFREMEDYLEYLFLETSKGCPVFRDYHLRMKYEDKGTDDLTGQKHDKPEECLAFHDGTFRYVIDGELSRTYISRKGSLQIESTDGTGEYVISEIEWLDECTYNSTFIEANYAEAQAFFKKGQFITVYINTVDGDNFSYFTILNGAKVDGDMIKETSEFTDPREE